MTTLQPSTIKKLLDEMQPAPLVTIYMPTHSAPTPPNLSEDRRRFKNIRSKVLEILRASPEIDIKSKRAIEQQLNDLEEDLIFWENRTFSVAMFISQSTITTVDLPIDSDEYVAVDSQFHITPLLGLVHECVDFNVLVVSKKHPMLFTGNMYGLKVSDVQLPEVASKTDRRKTDETSRAVHVPPKGRGRQEYFGDNFPLVNQDDVLHFFRAIDRVVKKHIPKTCLLVLAGPEQDVSIYRSISSIPNISKGHIESANSATTPHDLSPFAQALVHAEAVQPKREEDVARYNRLANGTERASGELAAIQDAADKGRVETLIIKLIRTTTDTIRDNKQPTPKIHFPVDEQMAVIENVALRTWRNQGMVRLIEDTLTTPPNTALAAIFRY